MYIMYSCFVLIIYFQRYNIIIFKNDVFFLQINVEEINEDVLTFIFLDFISLFNLFILASMELFNVTFLLPIPLVYGILYLFIFVCELFVICSVIK